MNASEKTTEQLQQKSLRLWPGIVIVILQWLIWFVIPVFVPDAATIGVFGGVLGGIALLIWWLFFSRAPRRERWIALIITVVAFVAISKILDQSIARSMMGLLFAIYSIPVLSLAFVGWALLSRRFSNTLRRVTMVATIVVTLGAWAFIRTNGMDGQGGQFFTWRWASTAEGRLLAKAKNQLVASLPSDSAMLITEAECPGFRGPNRDGIVKGVQIKTDWSKTPPTEMWRRSVGPGCSSFAIQGKLLFTQEQRGEYEMVTCYNLDTGAPVWKIGRAHV